MGMAYRLLHGLQRVAAMEVFWNIFAIVFLQKESATWVLTCKLSDIKDEIIENDKLLFSFGHLKLKILLTHHCVQRLVEFYWLLSQEVPMSHFHYQEHQNEKSDCHEV